VPDEILHRLGCLIRKQLEVDIPRCGVHHCRFRDTQRERFRWRGGSNWLFFSCCRFIENVAVPRFTPVYVELVCPLYP
jgi:hypothetical protein